MSEPLTAAALAAITERHAAILRTREALGPRATFADVYALDPAGFDRLIREDVPALLAAAQATPSAPPASLAPAGADPAAPPAAAV